MNTTNKFFTYHAVLCKLPTLLPFNVFSPDVQYNVNACIKYIRLWHSIACGVTLSDKVDMLLFSFSSEVCLMFLLLTFDSFSVPNTGNCSCKILDIVAPGSCSSYSWAPAKSCSSNFIIALTDWKTGNAGVISAVLSTIIFHFFVSAIWLAEDQLWSTDEETASPTGR